jgi:hypothetical protein
MGSIGLARRPSMRNCSIRRRRLMRMKGRSGMKIIEGKTVVVY